MGKPWRRNQFAAGILIASSAIAGISNPVLGQPVPDATLPGEQSDIVRVNANNFDVVGGSRRGANLFHSFLQFNINTRQSVYFRNQAGVDNILVRVTGSNRSDILGVLGIERNNPAGRRDTNLFLLNPNSIFLGSGARLDIGGSFVGTTANAIQLGDRGFFSATNPAAPSPLLTVAPSALEFNQGASQAIAPIDVALNSTRERNALAVPAGENLLLVGGNISINRSILRAPNGRVELGALATPTTVGLVQDESSGDLRLNFPRDASRANILLDREGQVNVTGDGGGNITLYAHNLTLSDDSALRAGIGRNQGAAGSRAGDIVINATGAVSVTGNSRISSEIDEAGIGRGGDIVVEAASLTLFGQLTEFSANTRSRQTACLTTSCDAGNIVINVGELEISNPDIRDNGAELSADTNGFGNAGNIQVNVTGPARILNRGSIFSNVSPRIENRLWRGGRITINAQSLVLENQGRIETSVSRQGLAGSILVRVTGNVSLGGGLRGPGRIRSNLSARPNDSPVPLSPDSRGGNIRIEAGSVSLTEGGFIEALTATSGNAGNIEISTTDLTLSGFNLASQFRSRVSVATEAGSSGQGGTITLHTGNLSISDGAAVSARTEGTGTGGNIIANADRIDLRRGGQIVTSAYSSGTAGNIIINADESVFLSGNDPDFAEKIQVVADRLEQGIIPSLDVVVVTDGSVSGLFARTRDQGDAGNLSIQTRQLQVEDGAQITASTASGSSGRGGSITIEADQVDIRSQGEITVGSEGTREAGNLVIIAPNIRLDNQGRISAATLSSSGGDITLRDVNSLTLSNGSEISASTVDGVGGRFTLNSDQTPANLVELNNSRASTEATGVGDAGSLIINARNLVLQQHSDISAATQSGEGGDIVLQGLDTLQMHNRSTISASTTTGTAGNLSVDANNAVLLNDRSRLAVEATAGGTAGNLTIATEQLTVQDRSRVSVSSTETGQAGDLTIAARDVFLGDRARIIAETAAGEGGNIDLQIADSLSLQSNSRISASTDSGQGGNIRIRGLDRLQVDSSEISAAADTGEAGNLSINAPGGSVQLRGTLAGGGPAGLSVEAMGEDGIAGNLTINTRDLIIQDGAQATVSSEAGRAGNLIVNANTVFLDQGRLTAETAQSGDGEGAVIELRGLDTLIMRHRSRISAEALEDADGGNITIDNGNGFIIAVPAENSDIVANTTDRGDGGRIDITTQGIFGLESRPELTSLSDINASSRLGVDGEVIINTPDVDPSRGLIELPTNLVDASQQIAQSCPTRGAIAAEELGSFVITGRGGLPPNPSEMLDSEEVLTGWVIPDDRQNSTNTGETVPSPTSTAPLLEAQGWTINPAGEIILIAQTPGITSAYPVLPSPSCNEP